VRLPEGARLGHGKPDNTDDGEEVEGDD